MSTHNPTEAFLPPGNAPAPEEGIDLFDVVVAVLSEWRLAVVTFLVVSVLCFLYISSLQPQYVAKASFLPQEGRSEGGSLAALFSNHGPGALYIGLLQSRTVQDKVIDRANLLDLFHANSIETARNRLSDISTFAEGADTIVTISVRETDARQAAKIAECYLEALSDLNKTMGLQQSSETTEFFEKQLDSEKDQLTAAEAQLAQTQSKTGIVSSDAQTTIGLGAIASTRSRIQDLEAQRSVLLQSETEQNPQVERLTAQIADLRGNERQMEGTGAAPVGAAVPAGEMPKGNLDIVRAQRAVKYHEVLVTSLANQFETARLNEAFSRSAFQVVDHAVAPEHKAWPPRKPFFLISLVFAALLGLTAVALKLMYGRVAADPGHREQISKLRKAFGSR